MSDFRACLLVSRGVIIKDDKVLLVKHQVNDEIGWVFPGGRVEENESLVEALVRECKEETGYDVVADSVCYLEEYLIYYATYFKCRVVGGDLKLGSDPDMPEDHQVIKDVRWIDVSEFCHLDIYPEGLKKMIMDGSIQYQNIRLPEIYR